MRLRLASVLLLLAGFVTLSLTRGQDGPVTPLGTKGPVATPGSQGPPGNPVPAPPPAAPARDFSKYAPLQQQFLLSAQRGADWLSRMNDVKGRFLYGYLPDLKTGMEGDHYLRQAGAAFALARAARFTGNDNYAAQAAQAILVLLDETTTDPKDPSIRYTALPSVAVNRLGAAGLLVLAIHELPAPKADLLDKSDQLCTFIRRQARPDGSLRCSDAVEDGRPEADDADAVNQYPGTALYALMRSQKHRPAAWKTELVRKAVAYYLPWWRAHKSMAFVPWQTAAYAEAYLLTKDKTFADAVLEMNDWLCELQYVVMDLSHPLWNGGFKGWADGRVVEAPPDVGSACYAEGLADACRVARELADVTRHQRYSESLERCLQFLTTLQYTDANTLHFAEWYRSRLVGAFHASHQDGNLRVDYTQHALAALVQYLEHVAP
jgi:hypothetical protein